MEHMDTILLYCPSLPLLLVGLYQNNTPLTKYSLKWIIICSLVHLLKDYYNENSNNNNYNNNRDNDNNNSNDTPTRRWRWFGLFISPLYFLLAPQWSGISSSPSNRDQRKATLASVLWFIFSILLVRGAGSIGMKWRLGGREQQSNNKITTSSTSRTTNNYNNIHNNKEGRNNHERNSNNSEENDNHYYHPQSLLKLN